MASCIFFYFIDLIDLANRTDSTVLVDSDVLADLPVLTDLIIM